MIAGVEKGELLKAVLAASDDYDADIFVYSGSIDDDGLGKIAAAIADHKNRKNGVLILTTNGGLPNSAYQIARLFQKSYDEFILCAPAMCKSAGTLIALGCHSLLVDMFSELGPLDVQLAKQNEIAARKSGLLSKASFDALGGAAFDLYERLMISITIKSSGMVSFKLASELAATMTGTLLSPVFAQMNPDVVGSEERDLDIALAYGKRLIENTGNASLPSVYKLVHGYPSHDFIIDDDEARELFAHVDVPSDALYEVIGSLRGLAYDEAREVTVFGLTPSPEEHNHDANEKETIPGRGAAKSPLDDYRKADRRGNSETRRRSKEQVRDGIAGRIVGEHDAGSRSSTSHTSEPVDPA